MSEFATLDALFATVKARKGASAEESYTARLFAKGRDKIAQKLGEEAVELAIAAVTQQRKGMLGESADLLYHLLVLWAEAGIEPGEVMALLTAREGTSGLEEKRQRFHQ